MTVNSSPTNIYNNNNDNNHFYFQRLNTFTEGIFFLYATGGKKLEIVIKDNDGNDDNNKTYFFQAYVQ